MARNRIALLFSAVQTDGEMTLEAAPATASAEIYPASEETAFVQLGLRMTRPDAERLLEALYSGNASVLVESLAAVIEPKGSPEDTLRLAQGAGQS